MAPATTVALATAGCSRAGAAYTEQLSPELVPAGYCTSHLGDPVLAGDGSRTGQPDRSRNPDRPNEPPSGLFDRIKSWFR